MKNRLIYLSFLVALIFSNRRVFSQDEKLNPIEYRIIAEGTDSPIPELQIVCYNKYFNKDFLPTDFSKKYNLDEKTLYKKKMLIEIFQFDSANEGLDKIELQGVKENDTELVVEYDILNSNPDNDNKQLSPFLILQVPKSKKKMKLIANGIELGKSTGVYVD